MTTPPAQRALRKGRVSLPGHLYVLTTVTSYRRPIFRHHDAAHAVARCSIEAACWGDAHLLCWVLMPDHWHGLVQLGERDNLSVVMNRFKAFTTGRLRCSQAGMVWDRGFHDSALRPDEDVRAVARYIISNPQRAGLVDHILDYPYWNAIWL